MSLMTKMKWRIVLLQIEENENNNDEFEVIISDSFIIQIILFSAVCVWYQENLTQIIPYFINLNA